MLFLKGLNLYLLVSLCLNLHSLTLRILNLSTLFFLYLTVILFPGIFKTTSFVQWLQKLIFNSVNLKDYE